MNVDQGLVRMVEDVMMESTGTHANVNLALKEEDVRSISMSADLIIVEMVQLVRMASIDIHVAVNQDLEEGTARLT